jgi:NADH-quinone oxidoreductase subunit A
MLLPVIVAYLALFAAVGFSFVFASLLLGRFLRANSPTAQKVAPYECGEPAVGSGAVQFDLRFYVVALLFLIFEVEVAFFFPPATIFGKARELQSPKNQPPAQVIEKYKAMGVSLPADDVAAVKEAEALAPTLSLTSMLDLGVFFAVLLVGFAFIWRRGDLNWVRAAHHPATPQETAEIVARFRRGD